MRRFAILAALVLVVVVPITAPPARAQGPSVSVLVDFGDGTYLWTDVDLPPTNVTALKATEMANASWGLPPLEVTWIVDPLCLRNPCAFVTDIGDRNASYPVWWHFYLWNGTEWEFASYGPSDTDLLEGDVIAWYLAVDDPATFASPRPVPRPTFRDVWTSFRGDLENRGFGRGPIPVTGREAWSRYLCPGIDCPIVVEIDAAPVAAYGMVYVVMRDWVVAVDAGTGETVWTNRSMGGLLSTPAIYDGRLIFGGANGRLYAVDAFTGRQLWNLVLEPGGRSTGIASSPAVYMGRAYVGTFNESDGGKGRVVAVNLNNGTVAWAYDAPGVIHMSSPSVRAGNLYVGIMGTYDGVVGYGPPHGVLSLTLDGTLRWSYETDGPVAASPVLAGGRAFVTDKAGFLYAITEDGSLDWQRSIGPSTSSAALSGNRLFVGSGGFAGGGLNATGHVWAFDLAGNELWDAPVAGPVQASPVTDGRLVCAGTNVEFGFHFCLSADDGSQVWVGPMFVPQGSYVLGSPTIAGGTLFSANDAGLLVAYRDAPPAEHPVASIRITSESPLRPGVPNRLRVSVVPFAAIYNVTLRVTLPAGLRLLNETDAGGPRTFSFELGDLGLSSKSVFLDVLPMEGYESWTVTASASYIDFAGRAYPELEARETFAADLPPPPHPALDWMPFAALGLAATAFLVGLLLLRRRRRGPVGGSGDA